MTFRHIASSLTLHTCPPKLLPQIMIYFGSTRWIQYLDVWSSLRIFFFKAALFGTTNWSLNHNVPSAFSWKQVTFRSPSCILLFICLIPISHLCAAMISLLKVGVRVNILLTSELVQLKSYSLVEAYLKVGLSSWWDLLNSNLVLNCAGLSKCFSS
jgi:hypothetical protein